MTADTLTKDRLQWLDAILADPDLGATFRLAYLISGHVSRKTGDAWPGLGYLAATLGMNERSVRRMIDLLVSRGFLVKKRGGDGKPNRYRMVMSDRTPVSDQNETRPDTDVHSEISDRTFVTDRLDISVTQTGHQCPPNSLKNSLKELSEEESISVSGTPKPDLEFEDLWSHYPRKVAKGRARSAFKAALKRTDLPTIKAGVLRYAAERTGQDPQFTKHLASWLNAECWNDEPAPPRVEHMGSVIASTRQTGKDRTLAALRQVRGGDT
ncbi:MAG: hypothetical protein U1E16_03965 [Hyphomicrobiales bacterium]